MERVRHTTARNVLVLGAAARHPPAVEVVCASPPVVAAKPTGEREVQVEAPLPTRRLLPPTFAELPIPLGVGVAEEDSKT